MALIRCIECGGQVSDMAGTCPHCGCPLGRQVLVDQLLREDAIYQERIKGEKLLFCWQCGRMGISYSDVRTEDPKRCSYCIGSAGARPLGSTDNTYDEILEMALSEPDDVRDPNNPDLVNDWIMRHLVKPGGFFHPTLYERRLQREALEKDPEYRLHRKELAAQKLAEQKALEEARARQKAMRPQCPNCKSYNVGPISTLSRGASVVMFGIFSGKIGKTYECSDCGYKW